LTDWVLRTSFVPEGTTVSVHTYALQRDPRYFYPAPDAFWPERWLSHEERSAHYDEVLIGGGGGGVVVTDAAAFVPFSYGPENCVGKNLAMLEMRTVVATVVHRLDLRLESGFRIEEWEEGLLDRYIFTKGSLPVVVSPRKTKG